MNIERIKWYQFVWRQYPWFSLHCIERKCLVPVVKISILQKNPYSVLAWTPQSVNCILPENTCINFYIILNLWIKKTVIVIIHQQTIFYQQMWNIKSLKSKPFKHLSRNQQYVSQIKKLSYLLYDMYCNNLPMSTQH